MIGVSILGVTGSIGQSTLDVIARHPKKFQLVACSANRSVDAMVEVCRKFRPRFVAMADAQAAEQVQAKLRNVGETTVGAGEQALVEVARHPEAAMVMAAIVGAAGLQPTLAAVRAAKRVLLANKEVLVMTGRAFMQAVRDSGAQLLPIDSEHNAVYQCLPGGQTSDLDAKGVTRIILTASGGPFRDVPIETLRNVTPDQACAHPNWAMGRKISVDSATMMNKGLEVIEAGWLFDLPASQIEVVIHPQSVIHSMVSYADGSVLAQLGNPDMRTPIAHAMAWPERMDAGVAPLDLAAIGALQFSRPDSSRFPCLDLAYQALRRGGTAPAILNAANEVAVEAFLARRIGFTEIPTIVEQTLDAVPVGDECGIEGALESDRQARRLAETLCGRQETEALT